MNILLDIDPLWIAIPVVMIVVTLVFTLVSNFGKFKHVKHEEEPLSRFNSEEMDVQLKEKYMFRREVEFLYLLNKILPSSLIALPKVSIDDLIATTGMRSKTISLLSKRVDFVIFEESTMKPLLVVDIYDNSYSDDVITEQDPDIDKILKKVNLSIISLLVKNKLDEEYIKKEVFKALNLDKEKEANPEEQKTT